KHERHLASVPAVCYAERRTRGGLVGGMWECVRRCEERAMHHTAPERAARRKQPTASARPRPGPGPAVWQLLVRGLVALWWLVLAAVLLNGTKTLGNRGGPAVLVPVWHVLAVVGRQPVPVPLMTGLAAAVVLVRMAWLTARAYQAQPASA